MCAFRASAWTCLRSPSFAARSKFGQPTLQTHPHLIHSNELTSGVPLAEYIKRRQALLERLPTSSVAIVFAAPVKYASKNIFYRFRQSSDFYYLTGVGEPEAAIVLEKPSSHTATHRSSLFLRPKVESQELWDGPRTGVDAAGDLFSVDEAFDMNTLSSHLDQLLPRYNHVYVDAEKQNAPRKRSLFRLGSPEDGSNLEDALSRVTWSRVRPLAAELHQMRKIKSISEIALMRKAASLSANAHTKTMRFTPFARSEAALAAHFEYLCALRGAERPAYVPVVASGANALTIHYTANDHLLEKGDLVLMDAGCEMNAYASDITRTWPVSGTFSSPQKELYQAVLNVQKAMIPLASEAEGHTLQSLHQVSCDALLVELQRIGFNITTRELNRLYPHYIGHPIGLDLHESGYDQRRDKLRSGMVITIEPGVYVPPDSIFPRQFHNLGIRIEDEVLVCENHADVLTVDAPKEIADVEGAICGSIGLEPFWEEFVYNQHNRIVN